MIDPKPPRLEIRKTTPQPAMPATTYGALFDAARLTWIDPRFRTETWRDLIVDPKPPLLYHEVEVEEGREVATADAINWIGMHLRVSPSIDGLLIYRTLQTVRRFYRCILSPILFVADDALKSEGYPCLYVDGDKFELRLVPDRGTWSRSWTFLANAFPASQPG